MKQDEQAINDFFLSTVLNSSLFAGYAFCFLIFFFFWLVCLFVFYCTNLNGLFDKIYAQDCFTQNLESILKNDNFNKSYRSLTLDYIIPTNYAFLYPFKNIVSIDRDTRFAKFTDS